jgi:hypothetical protein
LFLGQEQEEQEEETVENIKAHKSFFLASSLSLSLLEKCCGK